MKSIKKYLMPCGLLLVVLANQMLAHAASQDKPDPTIGQLTFIDIVRFDSELQNALNSTNQEVKVSFYDKVSPNNTPERLQKWLSAVEKGGGVVRVEPPPGELVARDPFTLIRMLGSLWSAIKTGIELNQGRVFESTRGHDAVISLERNSQGEAVISKITFKKNVNDSQK